MGKELWQGKELTRMVVVGRQGQWKEEELSKIGSKGKKRMWATGRERRVTVQNRGSWKR